MAEFPKKYKQKIMQNTSISSAAIKKSVSILPISTEKIPGESVFLSLMYADCYQKYCKMKGDACAMIPSWNINTDLSLAKKHITQTKVLANNLGILRDKEVSTQDGAFLLRWRSVWKQRYVTGKIQKKDAVLDRSISTQTVVSSDEIREEKEQGQSYTIRCFVSTKNHSLDITLTQPETIFGGVAFALHPLHKKAKTLKGAQVIIPIVNRAIPVIFDERVDLYLQQGVKCIIPGHDELSFAIAKDHDLPTDIFSFDQNGLFTELAGSFAGKPVDEFTENIIQNLTDINNLISVQECEITVHKVKKTGELIKKHAHTELFWMNEGEKRCISSNAKTGIRLPLWSNTQGKERCLDESWLGEIYEKTKKPNQEIWLTSMIFSFVSDGYLKQVFHIEDVIDVCMQHAQAYPLGKEGAKLLSLSKKEDMISHEAFAEYLLEALDRAFAITVDEKGVYTIDVQSLCKSESPLVQTDKKSDGTMQNALLLLYTMQQYKENALIGPDSANYFFSRFNVWAKDLGISVDHILEHTLPMHVLSAEDIKEQIKIFDCEQIHAKMFLHGQTIDIQKWRNTARFITITAQEEHIQAETLDMLQKEISEHSKELNVIDIWLIGKIQDILEDYKDLTSFSGFQKKYKELIHVWEDDISRKYVEMFKLIPSSLSKKVALLGIAILCKATYAYLPWFAQELRDRMGRKDAITDGIPMLYIEGKEKNYTINLFMEIVDKLLGLKKNNDLKNHEKTQIIIQSNPDFFRFMQGNEESVKKILNAQELIHSTGREEEMNGYRTDEIIDIHIGLKKYEETDGQQKIISRLSLQQQVVKKQEYLQHLKLLLPQMIQAEQDPAAIEKKKQEIETVKEEIEQLEYEISKEKMKK